MQPKGCSGDRRGATDGDPAPASDAPTPAEFACSARRPGELCHGIPAATAAGTCAEVGVSPSVLRTLFDLGPIGYLAHSSAGVIIEANHTMSQLLGVPCAELSAKVLLHFIAPVDREAFQQHCQQVITRGQRQVTELGFLRPAGPELRSRVETVAALELGSDCLLSAVVDLTEQMRAREVQREAEQRRDDFLAVLAHELRNPLAPLLNAAQILRWAGNDPLTRERAAAIVERQVRHMVRLVDDLLDVSRITHGTIRLQRERVLFETIVKNALETTGPQRLAGSIDLAVTLPPLPVYLDGDEARLTQVLGNLLGNAFKFSRPGGRVELVATLEAQTLVICVKDRGIGIREEMLGKIFELFPQAGHPLQRATGGLGIGLALARRFVEEHRGTICARSEGPDHGSEFEVRLPLACEQEASPREAPAPPVSPDLSRRVLVVDDNVEVAAALGLLLEMMGHQICTVHSGAEALDRAPSFRPDVVLLDIGMPGMNGYEVARELRKVAALQDTVLVALTGWGSAEERKRAMEAGFHHHLIKPASSATLQQLLRAPRPAPAGSDSRVRASCETNDVPGR